jgi:site-specific recombinase XerD
VKKTTGGAGGQPPAPAGGGELVAVEATNEGKGQELVLARRGLARGGDRRGLTAAEFQGLSAMPLEAEWFANIDNPRTRRAYRIDIHEFMAFVGIETPEAFRIVHARARARLAEGPGGERELGAGTIRRKLAALSSLFEHLCDANAVTHNPVKGVKRPKVESYEGKTPALGDGQARALLDAPGSETLKGKRDRAILSVLLYHGLRREELCTLKVRDIHQRRGVLHLRVHGKGGKLRYLPLHPGTAELVTDYLEVAGHGEETAAALFRPVKNNTNGTVEGAVTADGNLQDGQVLREACWREHRGVRRALAAGHGRDQCA